jgi:hypothetical protein
MLPQSSSSSSLLSASSAAAATTTTTTTTRKEPVSYAFKYLKYPKMQYPRRLKLFFDHLELAGELEEQGQAFFGTKKSTLMHHEQYDDSNILAYALMELCPYCHNSKVHLKEENRLYYCKTDLGAFAYNFFYCYFLKLCSKGEKYYFRY